MLWKSTQIRWAGVLGIITAMAGLTATIIAEQVLPKSPRPKLQTTIAVNIGPLDFGWKSKTQEPSPPEPLLSRDRVRLIGTILGIAALPLAVTSWARRERPWWGLAICGFAVAAIAWQTFVIVFAVLLLSGALLAFTPFERRQTSG